MVRKKKELFYLSHINVITICVHIGIIGEKFSSGDISLGSDCRTRVSRLYNVDCFTVLTYKTKANYLDDEKKRIKNSDEERQRKIFFRGGNWTYFTRD